MSNSTPSCKICKNQTVLADAGLMNNISYLYCRTCKIEVNDIGYEIIPTKNKTDELDQYLSEKIEEFDVTALTFDEFDDLLDAGIRKGITLWGVDPGDDDEYVNPNFIPTLY